MRDKKRIVPFLKVFEKYWKLYPDLRFAQIMLRFWSTFESDPFYIEEDRMIKHIQKLIDERNKK